MQIGVDNRRAVESRRVFVVDSDEAVGTGLQFMLADEMETHVFATPAEALARSSPREPELVLLGAGVLEAEGAQIVTRLREAMPTLRILVVCFDPEAPFVTEAIARGANGTLTRPLKVEAVRQEVDVQLGRSSATIAPKR